MQEGFALIILVIFGAWCVMWVRAYQDTDDE